LFLNRMYWKVFLRTYEKLVENLLTLIKLYHTIPLVCKNWLAAVSSVGVLFSRECGFQVALRILFLGQTERGFSQETCNTKGSIGIFNFLRRSRWL